jgi:hypothetical protein
MERPPTVRTVTIPFADLKVSLAFRGVDTRAA